MKRGGISCCDAASEVLVGMDYLDSFQLVSGPVMGGIEMYWLHLQIISDESGMEVVNPPLFFLIFWWLSISSIMVSFWAGCGRWDWLVQSCIVLAPFFKANLNVVHREQEVQSAVATLWCVIRLGALFLTSISD